MARDNQTVAQGFSDAVRDIRQRFRLAQEDLAGRLGVRAITISRWERGVQRPSNSLLLMGALERLEAELTEERRARGPGRPATRRRRRKSARGGR